MKHLFIDFETYSSVDIKKSGNYKYSQSKDFEILLCGYMWDEQTEPTIIDLTNEGEKVSFMGMFRAIVNDSNVTIVCHNATFERICLKAYGIDIPVDRFFCTANMALYCGLPPSLDAVSQILNLKDKKLGTGKNLIKFFSVPCKATNKNGGVTRNFKEGNEKEWDEFKEYLKYDVLSEKEIFDKLSVFEFPQLEKDIYAADQRINDYGILADMDLANAAEAMNEEHKELVKAEMDQLFAEVGATNVNTYLHALTGVKPSSLNKISIPNMLQV